MLKRKSHTKSRKGCSNCKQRRIKCDELGPPCANCVARPWASEACIYEPVPPRASRVARISRSSGTSDSTSDVSLRSPNPRATPALSPCSFSSSIVGDRLLELELMHRWSSRTWTAFCVVPECLPYLLDHLPRAALSHGYLLNAMFASSAMDLATSSASSDVPCQSSWEQPSARYLRAALEYGNRASTEFRDQVKSIGPQNIDLVAYFSSMVAVVTFTFPQTDETSGDGILDRVCAWIEALLASCRIGSAHLSLLLDSPCPARDIATKYPVDLSLLDNLDAGTKEAINLMSSVSRQARLRDGRIAAQVPAYRLAVGQTKYSFAELHRGRMMNYYVNLFPIAGDEFAAAIKSREPMALFVMMYWGVIADKAHKEQGAWILGKMGFHLVRVVSQMIQSSYLYGIVGVGEGIAWTRQQVGLPPLGLEHWVGVTEMGIPPGEGVPMPILES